MVYLIEVVDDKEEHIEQFPLLNELNFIVTYFEDHQRNEEDVNFRVGHQKHKDTLTNDHHLKVVIQYNDDKTNQSLIVLEDVIHVGYL